MTANQWFTYCLAVFAGGIIPGPIMLLAMAAGAKKGVVYVLPAAMGNVFASILQVCASIALVSVISQSIDSLFLVMMAAGGIYLIHLGVSLLRANPFKVTSTVDELDTHGYSKDFVDVFLITILNPKAIMFFLALFPQVIPRNDYSLLLVFSMTTAFAAIALLCFIIYAVFGMGIKRLAGNGLFADVINYALSAMFIGMGGLAIADAIRSVH